MDAVLSRVLVMYLEPSTWLLAVLVVLVLILSSYRSASLSSASHEASIAEPSLNIWVAVGSVVAACGMLVVLFYFLNQLLVLLIVLFAVAAFSSCVAFVLPPVVKLRRIVLPRVPDLQHFVVRG